MFNLIKKDMLLQKKTFNYIILFIIIFSLIMNNLSSDSRYLIYVIVTVASLVLTPFAYDEYYKIDIVLNSFPVNRKDIVLSKYISIMIYIILSLVVIVPVCYFLIFLNLPINMEGLHLKNIIDIFSINFLIYSVGLLIIFKFGYKKGRIIFNFALFGSMFMLVDVYGAVNKIFDKNFSFTMLIISIIIFFISLVISTKIYENKDLA